MKWTLNNIRESSRFSPLASQNHCRKHKYKHERKRKHKYRSNYFSGWIFHRNTVSQTHTISNVSNIKCGADWNRISTRINTRSAHTCSDDIRKSPAYAYLTAATLSENTMNAIDNQIPVILFILISLVFSDFSKTNLTQCSLENGREFPLEKKHCWTWTGNDIFYWKSVANIMKFSIKYGI